MRDITEKALRRILDNGAEYGDIRIVKGQSEAIEVKNGKVDSLSSDSNSGFGIRVIADGAWGFASSCDFNFEEVDSIADMAVRIARASACANRDSVKLSGIDPVEGRFTSPCEIDPFEVPLNEKIQLLLDADHIITQNPDIKVTSATMNFWKTETTFASTEGSYIEQVKTESGAGISATAIGNGDVQTRSHPSSMGGDFSTSGYEFVNGCDLIANAERITGEASALLYADQCPSVNTSLILEGSMLALQVHESCGHPVELDRVFGTESSYAGTSFLMPEMLNDFQYGSNIVNINADATIPNGLGSFFYDDEGVPAQKVVLVENGVFKGYLTSRETAEKMGWSSSGAMRADGWNRIPIIRMTNINLEPGDWTLDEMIEDTKDGIFAEMVSSWSIDDKRLNFQFATEIAHEIKDGSVGRILKNPTYTGITYDFWRGCDAIANEDEWHLWGVPNCGKGEPVQSAHVGHGVAPARFRNVRLGVMESAETYQEADE
ncbi:MAG: TldD/PmbA family protein [Armatimonadota bacterium]